MKSQLVEKPKESVLSVGPVTVINARGTGTNEL